jgi:hypothetical protein
MLILKQYKNFIKQVINMKKLLILSMILGSIASAQALELHSTKNSVVLMGNEIKISEPTTTKIEYCTDAGCTSGQVTIEEIDDDTFLLDGVNREALRAAKSIKILDQTVSLQ